MTVTITAYKRPELLRRCLESVYAADLTGIETVIVYNDKHTEETRRLVCAMNDFMRKPQLIVYYHKDRYGVANNARIAYNSAMNVDNKICAIEEDVIVSRDAFIYAQAMLREAPAFVNLCSHQDPLGTDPTKVHEDNQLRGGYGWVFTKDMWEYMEPRWNGKNRPPYGWDWYVTYLCYRERWKVLTPEVSRVFNTGREGGTYDTPENYDKRFQRVCDVVPERYEIVKHDLNYEPPAWVQDEMR